MGKMMSSKGHNRETYVPYPIQSRCNPPCIRLLSLEVYLKDDLSVFAAPAASLTRFLRNSKKKAKFHTMATILDTQKSETVFRMD